MKILQTSDYRIYFDDVRMDPYIKNWSAACGLRASDAVASMTMYRTKKLEEWKGYLTQVRVFALNVFSGKYCIVFEGEITNRNWSDARVDTGEITFACKGFYHWLNIKIPLMIDRQEKFDHVAQFRYEAENIDVEGISGIYNTRADLIMKDKPIKDIIETLFEKMYKGYNQSDDSTFEWAKLKERFKVMGDVIKEFRNAGYLDTITFIRTTQIESFYVYLNQVLQQLMFEFYQDRDGAFRIKTPSWSDDILKAHVIDEAVVQSASGFNDWENEPTRVLVIGGKDDVGQKGSADPKSGNVINVPMGLYIGLPGKGEYFSQNVQVEMMFGTDTTDVSATVVGGSGMFQTTGKRDGPAQGVLWPSIKHPLLKGPTNIHPVLAERLVKLAQSKGKTITMTDGGRTYADQLDLKRRKPTLAARAGYSKHEAGLAVDVKDGWLNAMTNSQLQPYGLHKTVLSKGETWHIEPLETGTAISRSNRSNNEVIALFGGLSPKGTGGGSGAPGGKAKVTPSVRRYEGKVREAAVKYGVPAYVELLLAKIQQESGGNLPDVMQSSESLGLPRNSIKDPNRSIDVGVKYFANILKQAGGDVPLALQSYNFGSGFILYAKARGGYSKANAIAFSKMMAAKKGWKRYGDTNYVDNIMRYYTGMVPKGTTTPSDITSGSVSPNASTGGFTVKTSYGRHYEGFTTPTSSGNRTIARLPGAQKNADHIVTPVEYKAPSHFRISYPLPLNDVGNYVRTSPNGVEHDMIGSIIEVASGWKEKAESGEHVGLMGIHSQYYKTQPNVTKKMLLDPKTNVMHGTTLFQNAYNRFGHKVTFALASLYLGNMALVEAAIKNENVMREDFTKARLYLPADAVAFVDKVIGVYTELYGAEYIKGDPHFPVTTDGKITGEIDKGAVADPAVKDYESSYKPIMSDEEKLYKLNLKVSEQLLIRYQVEQNDDQKYSADEMVERYAKYVMQLFRAESHGVNIVLSTCMPFLRPGFNAWFEPTRRNFVFYITRVTHQGSFGNGAFSSVNGAFVRDPKTYSLIEDNIFVADTYAKASDFGEVVDLSNMNALQTELKTLHSNTDETIGDARTIPTLSKIYSSAKSKQTAYSTSWTDEMSAKEIESKIATLYKDAPKIIQNRKANLKKIVAEAADFFTKMLLNTKV